jgi:outer membrane protein assembly factor BamA
MGNKALSDGELQRAMKQNKERWFLSFITGRGTFQENLFEEDAQRIVEKYREEGFIFAQVGAPELKYLGDSKDGDTRWVELRVPVIEGERHRIGKFTFEGNTVVKADALRTLFEVKEGDWYSQKKVRKGFQKTQEVYGSLGYYEFTGYPEPIAREDVAARTIPTATAAAREAAMARPSQSPPAKPASGKGPAAHRRFDDAPPGRQAVLSSTGITFVGNTNTRDNVIRREIPPVREQPVRHGGTAEQHQPHQPARVLQTASGSLARTSWSTRRRASTTSSTSR